MFVPDMKELQEELNGMCEVTARVASALKSTVEETAQTREAVALLNDQAFISANIRLRGGFGMKGFVTPPGFAISYYFSLPFVH